MREFADTHPTMKSTDRTIVHAAANILLETISDAIVGTDPEKEGPHEREG